MADAHWLDNKIYLLDCLNLSSGRMKGILFCGARYIKYIITKLGTERWRLTLTHTACMTQSPSCCNLSSLLWLNEVISILNYSLSILIVFCPLWKTWHIVLQAICEIWGSHGGEYEGGCVLGYCALVEVYRRLHGATTQKTAIFIQVICSRCFCHFCHFKLVLKHMVSLHSKITFKL
jgi:hypothetical protein